MKSFFMVLMLVLAGCSSAPKTQTGEEKIQDQHTWSGRPHWDRVYR